MKKIFFSLLVMAAFLPEFSYGQAFDRDDRIASFGVGVGSSLGSFSHSSQVPALSLMYEQGIAEVGDVGIISLGGYLGFKNFSYDYSVGSTISKSKWNYTMIGVRGAFHFSQIQVENLDVYAGALLSYNIVNYSYQDNTGTAPINSGSYNNTLGLSVFGGARYYFSEQFAGFAELGYGISYLNLGVSYKF